MNELYQSNYHTLSPVVMKCRLWAVGCIWSLRLGVAKSEIVLVEMGQSLLRSGRGFTLTCKSASDGLRRRERRGRRDCISFRRY